MSKESRRQVTLNLSKMDYYYLKAIANRIHERPDLHATLVIEEYIRANLPPEFRDRNGNELREQESARAESRRIAQSRVSLVRTLGPGTDF